MTLLPTRRDMLAGGALAALGAGTLPANAQLVSANSDYAFEIERTDAEWRDMLTDEEYRIMREGGTETPRSSEWWDHDAPGTYHCKGCDLPVYGSEYKIQWDKGWVFFFHALPSNVLMGIDETVPAAYGSGGMTPDGPAGDLIEAHCRRCGSHLGHILLSGLFVVHCINGTALTFDAA